MKKIKYLFILLILLLSGCYNYRELNDLAITTAIGIDKSEKGFKLTAQVVNTIKSNGDSNTSGSSPSIISYVSNAATLQEAFRDLIFKSPRRVYANHIQLVIIGEDLANDGIYDILDLLFRDPESRKDFLVIVSKDTEASNILKVLTPLETINSKKLYDSLTSDSLYEGTNQLIDFEEMMNRYLNDKKEIIIPSVYLIGNVIDGEKIDNLEESTSDAELLIGTMAIFKDDKLLGYTNDIESKSLTFIEDKIENTILKYECEKDKYVAIELVSSKTNVNNKSKTLDINIKIEGKANITEINCDLDLENTKIISNIEKNFEKKIINMITNSINSLNKKYNVDVYGFTDLIYKNNPKFYKKNVKNNKNILNKLNIKVDAKIKIIEKGNIVRVTKK